MSTISVVILVGFFPLNIIIVATVTLYGSEGMRKPLVHRALMRGVIYFRQSQNTTSTVIRHDTQSGK